MPRRVGLAVLLIWALAGCGGDGPTAGGDPIRIGVVINCEGTFASAREASLAGAELPLIERGAVLLGTRPSAGISNATVAGRPVRLFTACERWSDRTTTIRALSTLVERDGADIVLGPEAVGDSTVVRDYAHSYPGITFLATGFDQSATLKHTTPNLYRFEPDFAQWYGGLGAYARRKLGWKTAGVVGEPDPAGWPQVAGFMAEFCSLGGRASRFWPSDLSSTGRVVRRIPDSVDGVLLTGSSAGGKLGGTGRFVHRWRKRHPQLGGHLLVGWSVLSATPALVGVVGASSDPYQATPAWNRYLDAYAKAFPHINDSGFVNQPYYDAMEPVLEALEQVHGDVSGHERRLMAALAALRYHSPEGLIRLDERHQAIAPIYLGRVERDASGNPTLRQIGIVKNVDQTFGGHFGPDTPAPSASQPGCVSGHPPPWAVSRDRG